MNLRVEFHGLDGNANAVKLGELRFDGEKITATAKALERVLREPIILPKSGGTLHATTDPVRFMESLCFHYKSPYFMASKARRS
jgi:hypothetical protein